MTAEHVDKIIGGIFDLLKVLLGAVITWYVAKRSARNSELRSLKKGLVTQKVAITVTHNLNQMPVQLAKFKQFVVENPDLLLFKGNSEFCDKWLADPFLGVESAGSWTKARREQLLSDLANFRAPSK